MKHEDTCGQEIVLGNQYPARAERYLEKAALGHDGEPGQVTTTRQKVHAARWRTILTFVWSQWFIILFAIAIVVAYLAPNVARRGGYLASEYSFSYGGLCVIFLVAGLTMPTKLLIGNLGQWRPHLVTQGMCFVITPLIGLALVECVIGSGNEHIPDLFLAGIVIMACSPTTVASNITFTRLSGGDDAIALVEVVIGNLLGIFISPALVQLFLRPSIGLGVGAPTQSVGAIYKELIKHFGLALYLPLFVAQGLRNLSPDRVDKWSKILHLPKWASICLLLFLWQTFSDAFHTNAFQALPTQAILLIVFLNLGLYPFFTLVCYLVCRPPGSLFKSRRMSKRQTIAVCFCGPPKSITVGLVLISIQYSNFTLLEQAIIAIPLTLYQGMQIFIAQCFVPVFRHWVDLDQVVNQ